MHETAGVSGHAPHSGTPPGHFTSWYADQSASYFALAFVAMAAISHEHPHGLPEKTATQSDVAAQLASYVFTSNTGSDVEPLVSSDESEHATPSQQVTRAKRPWRVRTPRGYHPAEPSPGGVTPSRW